MKIKTKDLISAALDYAVATANGWVICDSEKGTKNLYYRLPDLSVRIRELYHPSASWAQAGPIIEREKISVIHHDSDWRATNGEGVTEEAYSFSAWELKPTPTNPGRNEYRLVAGQGDETASTPLIAAMRCFVASKLGDEVDVPDELLSPK